MYQSSREETNIGIEHSHGGHILIEYQRTKCFKLDSIPRSRNPHIVCYIKIL